MKIGILKETTETEQRVALVPQIAQLLSKQKVEWIVESGAGIAAGFKDSDYADHGMVILNSAAEVLEQAEIVIHISPIMFKKIAEFSRQSGKRIVSIGMTDSLWIKDLFAVHGNKNLISFSLDLMPRISRAQSMDVLSSMSTISGFKAVLLAADRLTKVIPMLTTAAGTIPPAKVLVLGSGVAGLQAMATAKRLGALVFGYDVRAATVDQIQSVGAKAVLSLEAITEGNQEKQRELLTAALLEADAVVTTALIPGGKAPILIPTATIQKMKHGAIIVDLAAERGGNTEITRLGETVIENGVSVIGPINLSSSAPGQASQMFTKNVAAFLKLAIKDGRLSVDLSDEILRGTLMSPTETTKEIAVPQKDLAAAAG